MLFLLLFFQLTFFFLSNVAALNITVQPDTIVGLPSLVLWTRQPSDGGGLLTFDLRFVKPGDDDVGLALANIQAPPSTQFGTAEVVFPLPGPCVLVAVSGPGFTRIGQSDQVNAYQVPTTSIPTSTSQPVPSATSSATTSSTSATSSAKPTPTIPVVRRKKNVGAIVGGTLGGVAFLGILAALGILFLRRRRQQPATEDDDTNNNRRRWTFHRDKMILPPVLDIRRTTPMTAGFLTPDDIEQQQPHDDNNDVIVPRISTSTSTSPVVVSQKATSPRFSLLRSPNRPLPLDIEQHQVGLPLDNNNEVIPSTSTSTSPVAVKRAATPPRFSILRSTSRPLPLPPLPSPPPVVPLPPIPPQQQLDDMVVQMEQIRNQMTELKKNPGPTQHIILDDLQKQMDWFKSQIEKKSLS